MTRSPLQELKDALRRSNRAERIKGVWVIASTDMPDGAIDGPPGAIMAYPDPDDPLGDLVYEKIVYDGGTVIECEGVVVCRVS